MSLSVDLVGPLLQKIVTSKALKEIEKVPKKQQCLYEVLSKVAYGAFKALLEQRLRCFDALVGDTACQLRTTKVVLIHAEILKSADKQQHFKKIAANDKSEKLTDDDQFLILAHLLYLTRDKKDHQSTNYKNLTEFVEENALSDDELKSFVCQAKKVLAEASIQFLHQEAKVLTLLDGEKSALISILRKSIVVGKANLLTSPCFYNMQVLFENIRARGTPLVLVIHRVALKTVITCAFQSSNKRTFQPIQDLASCRQMGAVVVEGESTSNLSSKEYLTALLGSSEAQDAIDRFPSSRLLEVILTVAAKHAQYVKKDEKETIPIFDKAIPGTNKLNAHLKEVSTKMHHVFDEIVKQAGKQKRQDYAKLLDEYLAGIPKESGRLKKGLESSCQPVQLADMCTAYINRKRMELEAEKEGLCRENPSLFSIKHIYPDIIENHSFNEKVEKIDRESDEKKEREVDEDE